jgi:hypothetical protein
VIDLLYVGAGGCYAVAGALAVAAVKAGPGPRASAADAPVARLHVSDLEEVPVSAGPADLEAAGLDLTYVYCPAEFRVTPHVRVVDEELCCWRCPEGEAA